MGYSIYFVFFFFQAEDGIRDLTVTGVQTCALPIYVQIIREFFGKPCSLPYFSSSEVRRTIRQSRSWPSRLPAARGRNFSAITTKPDRRFINSLRGKRVCPEATREDDDCSGCQRSSNRMTLHLSPLQPAVLRTALGTSLITYKASLSSSNRQTSPARRGM